ncbi:MAG: hypothetical protein AAB909_00005, partial [Patescibacteria group bacterium]
DEACIEEAVARLETIFHKLTPYIKSLRAYIRKPIEQTKACAVYLLFWKVMRRWEVLFGLARTGRNQELLELLRSLHENLDLIMLFSEDKKGSYLVEWFKGEVIEAATSRQKYEEILGTHPLSGEKLPIREMKTFIYRLFSKYPHNSYPAVMEFVDVFSEGLDEDLVAGYHWTRESICHLITAMSSTLIQLKALYGHLGDRKSFAELDSLYLSITPPSTEEEIKEGVKKFQ